MNDFELELDDDGYPTEESLQYIQDFAAIDHHHELLEAIMDIWCHGDDDYMYFTFNNGYYIWKFHPGGWSGNESIVSALSKNTLFRLMHWLQSTGNVHYTSVVKKRKAK